MSYISTMTTSLWSSAVENLETLLTKDSDEPSDGREGWTFVPGMKREREPSFHTDYG